LRFLPFLTLPQSLYFLASKNDPKIIAGGKRDEDGLSL